MVNVNTLNPRCDTSAQILFLLLFILPIKIRQALITTKDIIIVIINIFISSKKIYQPFSIGTDVLLL